MTDADHTLPLPLAYCSFPGCMTPVVPSFGIARCVAHRHDTLPLHAYAGFVPGPSSSLGQDSGEPAWTPAPLTVRDRIEIVRLEVRDIQEGINAAENLELVNWLQAALTELSAAARLLR